MLRIHDLISELEDQVGPLKDQSEKAIRYKELREQLKHLEISVYVHQIEGIHTSWQEGNARLEVLKTEQLELSTVVSAHDAKLESGRAELRSLEQEVEKLQEQLRAAAKPTRRAKATESC